MTAARVGRPPLTSRADLLAGARALGIDGLTVGKVTEAVGVKYSTFYRHFETLDELVAALVDDVLSGVHVMTGTRWRMSLQMTAHELAGYCAAWPGLAEALWRLPERPWSARALDAMVTVLVDAGMDAPSASQGAHAVLAAAALPPDRYRPSHVELLLDGLAGWLGQAGEL